MEYVLNIMERIVGLKFFERMSEEEEFSTVTKELNSSIEFEKWLEEVEECMMHLLD